LKTENWKKIQSQKNQNQKNFICLIGYVGVNMHKWKWILKIRKFQNWKLKKFKSEQSQSEKSKSEKDCMTDYTRGVCRTSCQVS